MFLTHLRLKSKIAMYFTEHPCEVIGAGELAHRLNQRAADVAEVLLKMYDAGLLVAEQPADEVLFSLNPDHPVVAGPVRKLAVDRWYSVLHDRLSPLPGIQRAVVYWEEPQEREPFLPSLQVLAIGAVDPAALDAAIQKAERELQQSISAWQLTRAEHNRMQEDDDSALRRIYAGPHQVVVDRD